MTTLGASTAPAARQARRKEDRMASDAEEILRSALKVIAGSSTAYLRGWCQRHCRDGHGPIYDPRLRQHVAEVALALADELRYAPGPAGGDNS